MPDQPPTTPADAPPVTLDVRDGVGTLTLSAPGRGNALGLEAAELLRDAVTGLSGHDDVRVVRLTAQGRTFCVGGDLAEFRDLPDVADHVGRVARAASAAVEGLWALPMPVVTDVRGAAAGGGLGLALSGDVVLTGRSARFVPAFTAMGLSPDSGVTLLLTRALGPRRALDVLLSNRALPAEEALALGLVSRVVDDDDLDATAAATVAALAALDPASARATKRLVRAAVTQPQRDVLDAEAASIAALAAGAPAQARMRAFLDRSKG